MRKAGILLGVYLIASFSGALTGAVLRTDPFRMDDVLGFMIMCPLFQIISLVTGFNTNNLVLGVFLLAVCGSTAVVSIIGFCGSTRRWPLVTFAIPVFVASLQGVELFYEGLAA